MAAIELPISIPELAAIQLQLNTLVEQGIKIMADVTQLTSDVAQLKADVGVLAAALLNAQSQNQALQQLVSQLQAGQVTQEQIDAIDAQVKVIDATVTGALPAAPADGQ